jgi:pyruvate/2-oxoglutarate dehydrogenase complex dihydrolipoamide acyltransferase (E2) component
MTAEHSPEEQEEKGFIISDKRLFTPSGERVTDANPPGPAEPETETPPPPKQEEPAAAQQPQPPPTGADAPQDLPPVDFAAFVMMLTNNVMVFLGQVPNPLTQQPQVDLAQAQHTIDIIMMLREKTRGNLTTEEDRFLQELLPQLQMAYVQAKQQVG